MTIPNSTDAHTPCRSPEEERRIVSQLSTSLNEGDSYFVISKRWSTSWQRYTAPFGGAPRPGPIDNSDIIDITATSDDVDDGPQLRRFLVEDEDYVLVPQQVWKTLLEWYKGGPTVPMTLIYLVVSDAREEDKVTDIHLAKQASIRELYEKVCAETGVSLEKARIWDYFNMKKGELLHPLSNKNLEESGLVTDQDILLEVDGSSAVNELGPVPLGRSGLAGLVNFRNTCYMNSTLQCLAHTPQILQYFLRDYTYNHFGTAGELAKEFGELLKELWSSGGNAVKPLLFKTELDKAVPQFSGDNQQDSHELLISLLAKLHEVSTIVNVFQGQCKSTLLCQVCGERAITYEPFTCLSLPLPSTRPWSISLLYCLDKYLAEEPLGPDNMWFCPECKERRQANKKLDLWKLPDILVFQLKRFKTSKYFIKKIVTRVNFPVEDLLDLSEYMKNGESYSYELYAVSNHHGGIAGLCHYTAYAKLVDDNKWYHFNDTVVSPASESEIRSSAAAYLLFYRRVGSETKAQSAKVSKTDMDQS